MKYRVIKFFTDLQDGNHKYYPGDTYPREGLRVNAARVRELMGSSNRRGTPLIERVIEKKKAKSEEGGQDDE